METKIGKHAMDTDAQATMPKYHANTCLREDGIHIPLGGRLDAVISLKTLKDAIDMIEKKETPSEPEKIFKDATFKFNGTIRTEQTIVLEHLNSEEIKGINKFLSELKNRMVSTLPIWKRRQISFHMIND